MGFLDELLFGSAGTGKERAAEAQSLAKGERAWLMQQLGRQTGRIEEGGKRQMGISMGGQSAAAHAAREAQKKALENVAKYAGNPLAMSSALAQSGTNQLLGQIYQQGAGQRQGILGQQMGLLGQAEGLATSGRQNVLGSELGVLESIQDTQPGMFGQLMSAYMGMEGMKGMGGGEGGGGGSWWSSLFGGD